MFSVRSNGWLTIHLTAPTHHPAFVAFAFLILLGLDEELMAMIPQPVHALILLFPISEKYEAYIKEEQARIDQKGQIVSPNVVFYPQTISNACGTMGVLHSIANNWAHGGELQLSKESPLWTLSRAISRSMSIDLSFFHFIASVAEGGIMEKFLKKTVNMSPSERIQALEEDESLSSAHKSHASTGQTATPDLADEVNLHYVCLIERDGHLYELDGSKPYPINHGPTSKDGLLAVSLKSVGFEGVARKSSQATEIH